MNNQHSSKSCTLEVDLEYSKELHELHNVYHLASDKMEIKREMLPNYQIIFNIPIGNVKKLVPNYFDKEKYVRNYENL